MVDWIISRHPVGVADAVVEMERRVKAVHDGQEDEAVWLLEHPPTITTGTSAQPADVLDTKAFPVHVVSRGGQVTYHGPGQRVAYLMLDLRSRQRDARRYVHAIENWVIKTLAEFGIEGESRSERIGVWVRRPDGGEDKIAAIGIRLRRWVSFHGVSINLAPDLGHYDAIVPCGIRDHGITSMAKLGKNVSMAQFDKELRKQFDAVFGADGEFSRSGVI